MATGKRYYWIKLRDSFMNSDTVDFLMSQPDGANYVVLYEMLCLKAINTEGRLSSVIGEIVIPYDVEKIQRECKWFTVDTIRIALELYRHLGLIYEEQDGTLVISDHEAMIGSETDWGEKKRRQRNEHLALASGDNVPTNVPTDVPSDVPQNVPIEIRDKRLDIRDTELESNTSGISDNQDNITPLKDKTDNNQKIQGNQEYCAELPASGHSTQKAEPTPSEFDIPLQDGTTYNVPQENIEVYERLYPGVDVEQQLRNMIGWSMAAGTRRKTRRGIKRFITNWLIREQDSGRKGGANHGANRGDTGGRPQPVCDWDEII